MASPATSREQRLRKTKAKLIDEIEMLEQHAAAIEAGHGSGTTLERADAERKLTEEEIKESETQFRTLIGNIPGIVYRGAVDADWTMYFISDYVEEVTGYPASDFIDNRVRSFSSIIHPDDVQLVEDSVTAGLEENVPYVIDYRIINADGGRGPMGL